MKRKIVVIILMMMVPMYVKAASLSATLSCPESANASSEVSCTLKAKSSGANLKGLGANFEISGGTYSNFVLGSGWISYSLSSKGMSLQLNNPTQNEVTVGTLKVKMPSSGKAEVNITNIVGTDPSYNTMNTSNLSKSIRVKSTVNTLDSLTISGAKIEFDKNKTTYDVTIDGASTTISAVKTDQYSILSGTGTKTLKYGKNTYSITVTSESGSKKVYTVNVTRPDNRSTNNNLASLKVSNGTINFNKATITYSVEVEAAVSKIKVEGTLEDSTATFVKNYGPRDVTLNYGKNVIQIKVKAENESEKTYTINVTRKDSRSNNTNISEITLSSGEIKFDKNQTEYKTSV